MKWLDTHVHLINPKRLNYDWSAEVPHLQQHFDVERYRAIAEPLGVVGALHMEVDVRATDIAAEVDWVELQAKSAPEFLRGLVAACRPEDPNFPEWLEQCAARPLVRGFRRVLHVVPDETSRSTQFRQNVRRLAQTGHVFDVVVRADQLPLAQELGRACSDVSFVLDHCGNPRLMDSYPAEDWKTALRELARLPNFHLKVSGVLVNVSPHRWAESEPQQIAPVLRPYVEHVIECFGWDRVVWGSDHPVCELEADLPRWLKSLEIVLQGCSPDEIESLAFRNAERAYRLA